MTVNRRLDRWAAINPDTNLHYEIALDLTFTKEPWRVDLSTP
ncbi:MAG TPA: hypothetical protein VH592_06905 [Gemmataceae bacterium]